MSIKRTGPAPYGEGTFGLWLEARLYESDMLVKDVAKALNIRPTSVSNHLHGRTKPTFATVVAYCWFFNKDNPLQVWRFVERDWGR